MLKQIGKGCCLAVLFGSLAAPLMAHAGGYGAAGCGLGAVIIGDKPGMVQLFAGTTNAFMGNQTFGITSGTLNCAEGASAKNQFVQETFVAINLNSLSRDAAMGNGEYLSALSTLFGCEKSVHPAVFAAAQNHHGEIFTPGAAPDVVLHNFKSVLSSDESIGSRCTL